MTPARPLARLIEFTFVAALLLIIGALVPISGCGDGNASGNGGKPALNGANSQPGGGSANTGQPAGIPNPVSGYFGAVFAARDRALMLEAKNHLRSLILATTQLQLSNGRMQQSTGVDFWLALFIGDPHDTTNGLARSSAPLAATECEHLMCCGDPVNHDRMALMGRLRQAPDTGLDADSCSWAGPTLATVRSWKTNAIVGTSGQREGQSFFGDGYIVGKGSGAVDFVEYDDGQSLPKWGEGTLTGVQSYP